MMRITFNLPVIVSGMPGRVRDKRNVLGSVPVSHDVPVLSEYDAPIALAYVHEDKNGLKSTEEFLGYEGRLFRAITTRPAAEVNHVARLGQLDEDDLFVEQQKAIRSKRDWVRDIGKSYAKTMVAPAGFADYIAASGEAECHITALADLQVREYDEAAVAREIEKFRQKIAKLVIVGDRFYLSEPEPVIRMTERSGDVVFDVVRSKNLEFGIPKGSGRDLPSLGFFRMDQEEAMLAEGQAMATTGRAFSRVSEIAVYDPSILTANTEAMSLCEVAAGFAQRFLTQLFQDRLCEYEDSVRHLGKAMAEVPVAQVALYQRMINGVAAFKTTGDPSEVEAAVMSVLESEDRALERFYFLCQGNPARFAEAIGRRWNDREVSLDQGFVMSAVPAPRG
jgi:hypothetical protein